MRSELVEQGPELIRGLGKAIEALLKAKRDADLWELIQVREARHNLEVQVAKETRFARREIATGKNKETRDAQLAGWLAEDAILREATTALLCVESRLLELREEEEAAEWAVKLTQAAIRMHLSTMELVGRMEEA